MKIHINQIPVGGLQLEGEEATDILELQDELVQVKSPVRYDLDVGLSDGGLFATGTLEVEKTEVAPSAPEGFVFYNAAWLFSATGEAMGRYRKRHLVPFGEFIPFLSVIDLILNHGRESLRILRGEH